jgi:hypothetical protein
MDNEQSIEALVHQAFNYIQQHRPQLDRENGATTNPITENHNKGHVTDPEHDKRLTENKEKEDSDRKDKEEADEHQRSEDAKRNQNKLQQIKQLQQRKASYSPEEIALRNNPAIQKLFGSKPASIESLQMIRKNIKTRIACAVSIQEKNDFHTMLSNISALLIKANILKK